ncbi:hypothetical protein LTR12_003069 [Friedmanniomyces endolithicus]|nr:hypothetical protein LTR12_003069 [Friedmanniomyces endolithicus]
MDMDAEDDVTAFADSGCWSSSEQYEAGLHGIDDFDWGLPSSLAVEEQTCPAAPTVQPTKEGEPPNPASADVSTAIVDSEAAAHPDELGVSDEEPMDWESVVPRIRQHTKAELDESSSLTMLSDEGTPSEREESVQLTAVSDALSQDAHTAETTVDSMETSPKQGGSGRLALVSGAPSKYMYAQVAESTVDPVEALPVHGTTVLGRGNISSPPSAVSNITDLDTLDKAATTNRAKTATANSGTTIPITTSKHQVGERELKGLDKISPRGKTRRQTKDVVQARPSGAAKRRHQKEK